MLEWLTSPSFAVAGSPFTWGELLGFITGVVNVWLLVRQNPVNWPVGIANVLLLLVVFWHVGLYADAGLQIVYVALGFYGWWQWLFGGEQRPSRPATPSSPRAGSRVSCRRCPPTAGASAGRVRR